MPQVLWKSANPKISNVLWRLRGRPHPKPNSSSTSKDYLCWFSAVIFAENLTGRARTCDGEPQEKKKAVHNLCTATKQLTANELLTSAYARPIAASASGWRAGSK